MATWLLNQKDDVVHVHVVAGECSKKVKSAQKLNAPEKYIKGPILTI